MAQNNRTRGTVHQEGKGTRGTIQKEGQGHQVHSETEGLGGSENWSEAPGAERSRALEEHNDRSTSLQRLHARLVSRDLVT